MDGTQIVIDEETRETLRWVKTMTGSRSYSEAIELLVSESEYDIPDEPLDEGLKRLVAGDG